MFNYIMWSVFIYLFIILISNVFEDEILHDKHWENFYYDRELSIKEDNFLKSAIFCFIPLLRWFYLLVVLGLVFVDYYDVKEYLK